MVIVNGLPYYKAYPRDFIEGTIGWSFELKGAYRLVLDLIYMQAGKLPDDAGYICGLMGCTKHKWASLRKQLIDTGKIELLDGFLVNSRVFHELKLLESYANKQRENASSPKKNKGLQKPRLRHTEPEPEPEPVLFANAHIARAPDRFEEFWKIYPKREGPNSKQSALKSWKAALGKKHDPQAIIDGVTRYRRELEEADEIGTRFVAMASTYLNQERWNDDTSDEAGPPPGMSYWDWKHGKEKRA